MKQTIFKGSGVAIITPMLEDGSVNYPVLKELLEQQIAGGTDAIVICGTTGEASALNDTEHLDVIEFACATVNRRLPVIAGTGSNDTRHAVALSREAKNRGADALLQVTPYYNKTSQAGLVRHFNAVADAVGLPMILYNVPSRTGMNIQPETYAELAKHPLIVATKEASGNVSAIAKTAALCGDELAIYSGNDDQILPLLGSGRHRSDLCAGERSPAGNARYLPALFRGQTRGKPCVAASASGTDRSIVLRREPYSCKGSDESAGT